MIRLIQNEMTKVFKKKSIYIGLIIVLICIIFINCVNKYSANRNYDDNLPERITSIEAELNKYDPQKDSDTSTYISLKTYLDELKLIQKYGSSSWQETIITEKMSGLIEEMNTYEYGIEKDEKIYQITKEKYQTYIKKLDKNDWRYFAQTELEENDRQIELNEKEKEKTVDKIQLKQIEEKGKDLNLTKQVLQWRLDKDISYARSQKNTQLKNYQRYQQEVNAYESNPMDTQEAKTMYQNYLNKASVLKYSIENNITTDANDCRGSLINFLNQYGIFIAALTIMVAGTIVSDEFNKGTIKLLLVKPYKRWKIVIAKLITCILTMIIITIAILVMQFLVSGILFGFDSLSIPEIHYNFNTNQIETMNLFSYIGLVAIYQFPMFLITIIIAFMLSCLFTNSALAIVIALLGFMSTEIINMMSLQLNLSFMKLFITPNWNLAPYLFGGLSSFQGLTLPISLLIDIAYFIIMTAIAIFAFKKKNIKNI